ncbi:hypothetical protein BT67DRAFT_453385 [Trichocladium antarcticum]|uniref:Uncharacterized protein n=1 Tax=Trichocladium antarcticum TaxID=1450529 RepID=A0AAN6ZHQ7_9PEZI|nr:hypothetical protein BT67DRAFT_453385 [Trichocladium antarcticum]
MAPPDCQIGDNEATQAREKAENQAILNAMMDDLGMMRLESLPLEDHNNRHHSDHHSGHDGYAAPNRGTRPNPRGHESHARVGPSDFTMATPNVVGLWQAAFDTGVFDDEEAAAVQGLDDLGGGRVYATAGLGMSRKDKTKDDVRKLLEHNNKLSNTRSRQPVQVPGKMRLEGNLKNISARKPPNSHQLRTNGHRSTSQSSAPSITSRSPATSIGTAAGSAKMPRSRRPLPANELTDPAMNTEVQKLLKQDACGKPENTVFKVPVNFLSRTINPAAPAIIFLSTPNPPELGGLLTVNIYGRTFCEWPISKWSDYSTAADRSLIIMFTESGMSGESYGYQLNFNTDRDLTEFMTTMRSLQSGNYSSSAAPNTMVIPAANSSVRVADARAPGKIQGELRSTHALSGTAAVVSTASHNPLCEIASYASQDKMPAKKTGNPEKGATVITRQPPTEGDSHETSEGSASSSTLTQKQILATCSSLLHVFLFGGLEGKTKEEVGQTVEGIKAGVLDHVMHDARSQGLNSQGLQEIETLILGVFESLPSTVPKQKRRFQYSIEELMSMRHAAAKPPACLANLPSSYLPKSQNSGRKTSTSTHEAQISSGIFEAGIEERRCQS